MSYETMKMSHIFSDSYRWKESGKQIENAEQINKTILLKVTLFGSDKNKVPIISSLSITEITHVRELEKDIFLFAYLQQMKFSSDGFCSLHNDNFWKIFLKIKKQCKDRWWKNTHYANMVNRKLFCYYKSNNFIEYV